MPDMPVKLRYAGSVQLSKPCRLETNLNAMVRIHDEISLGRTIRRLELPEYSLSEVAYDHGQSLPVHAHAEANVSIVLRGAVTETVDGQERVAVVGCAVFKPALTPHSNRFAGQRGAAVLSIKLRTRDAVPIHPHRHWRYGWIDDERAAALGASLYRQFRSAPQMSCAALGDLIAETIGLSTAVLSPDTARPPCWLAQIREALHDSSRQPISVRSLAAQAGVHPVYLARVFRRYFQCNLREYRRRVQVNQAAARLTDSDESMCLIALRSGFSDQSHFCRAFRRQFGAAPAEFRALYR